MRSTPDTVCIFLGPLNNLTTLTATALAFHPNVQVLNHGARYLWEARGCNFLCDFTEANYQRFIDEAVTLSLSSGLCRYDGGSILSSHTFEGNPEMIARYIEMHGSGSLKDDIRCLVWKDPMEVERMIEGTMLDFHRLFAQDGGRLRFLLPIRNPLDTMVSISNGQHWKLLQGLNNNELSPILNRLFAMIRRFLNRERDFPKRFFHFTQSEFAETETLQALAEFLRLEPDEGWMEVCKDIWQIRPSYALDETSRKIYALISRLQLSQFPEDMGKLMGFAELEGTRPLP